jgi:UDP-glucose 4-epimerase
MYKNKVIVTGCAGFIGSHLCELLVKKNFYVIGLDNFETGSKKNLTILLKKKNFKFIKLNINKKIINRKIFTKTKYVFHLAALADIIRSVDFPKIYFETNVFGTMNILELIRENNIKKIIYSASASCYGIQNTKKPINEFAKAKPIYPYAESKFQGENIIKHYSLIYNIKYVSLRLFNVYGPRSRSNKHYGAAMGTFINQSLNKKPFTVVGDGTQTRDFIYVSDVCNAFYLSMKNNVKNISLNIGTSKGISVKQMVKLIDSKNKIIYIPKRPGEPDHIISNNSLATKILNWRPRITFVHGIKKVLENKNYWGGNSAVWSSKKIKLATKNWFKFLNKFSNYNQY